MYFNFLIKIPENTGKITLNTRGETTYVEYTYGRRYLSEKQYNIPQRTTIGKQSQEDRTMMYPNQNFRKFFPEVELPLDTVRASRSCCLRIGNYLVLRKIIEEYGLSQMLARIIGRKSGLLLDLAVYSILSENNAGQYYPDYAFNHPLFTDQMHIYSDATVSDFLSEITQDQIITFLNEWNAARSHQDKIYITYDSTNKSCQAGDIELAEYGHPKDHTDGPIFNYSIAYDQNNREPLFYEEYPGSIVDVAQLRMMLEKAKGYGYRHAAFILDRGYFSKPNISFMDRNGYDFVIMVKGMKPLVCGLIRENRGRFEELRKNYISAYKTYGTTVKGRLYPSDERERYFHLYYNVKRKASEQGQLEGKIDRMQKNLSKFFGKAFEMDAAYARYFTPIYFHEGQEDQLLQTAMERSDVIEEEIRQCGYFCIITSQEMSAKEALTLYKSRDASEKLFKGDKSFLGNRTLRVQSEESAEAKIFVEFIALILRNKMYTCLKDAVWESDQKENYMNVPAAIRELEKIEMGRLADGEYRLDHAVTATQKAILRAFQMDATSVKRGAEEIRLALKEQ